jgi:hypothetical protein
MEPDLPPLRSGTLLLKKLTDGTAKIAQEADATNGFGSCRAGAL